MGNGSVIVPGDVQRMSAGTGVMHSEHNHSSGVTHFLQIWIEPSEAGIPPGYEQSNFDAESKLGVLRLVASPDGRDGAVRIHQDAYLFAGLLEAGDSVAHPLQSGRRGYVHVARGSVVACGESLQAGDAIKVAALAEIRLEHAVGAEVLLFDLP